jgi:hypothetical protein
MCVYAVKKVIQNGENGQGVKILYFLVERAEVKFGFFARKTLNSRLVV